MAITFYPHEDELETSTLKEKLDTLIESSSRFKAAVLESSGVTAAPESGVKKLTTPRDLTAVFNWEEITRLLREIRELPEATPVNKLTKADHLTKLAEIYETLRAARMAKLEAVRIALINEATQLRASAAQAL